MGARNTNAWEFFPLSGNDPRGDDARVWRCDEGDVMTHERF